MVIDFVTFFCYQNHRLFGANLEIFTKNFEVFTLIYGGKCDFVNGGLQPDEIWASVVLKVRNTATHRWKLA